MKKVYPGSYAAKMEQAFIQIANEVLRAKEIYPANFNSLHEAYGVILEEVDELWEEIKRKRHDVSAMRREAVQASAMLVRLMVELCPGKE